MAYLREVLAVLVIIIVIKFMSIISLTEKWPSGVDCFKWTGTSCHKQTKDATLPKEDEGNTYTKKSHVRAINAAHTCFFVCVCHLSFLQRSVFYFALLDNSRDVKWRPNGHGSTAHQPLTAVDQWKISRHQSLWVAVGICTVSIWTAPVTF